MPENYGREAYFRLAQDVKQIAEKYYPSAEREKEAIKWQSILIKSLKS